MVSDSEFLKFKYRAAPTAGILTALGALNASLPVEVAVDAVSAGDDVPELPSVSLVLECYGIEDADHGSEVGGGLGQDAGPAVCAAVSSMMLWETA